jgi:hypothetical protein
MTMTSGVPSGGASSKVPLFNPSPPTGEASLPSRITLDSSLRRWFSRNLGLWRSRRVHFLPGDEVLMVDMRLRIECFSEPVEGEAGYRFTWWPEQESDLLERMPGFVPRGTMEAYLRGHQLRRSQGHRSLSPLWSQIRQVDEHELVLESHEPGRAVLEHIRLVDEDRYRAHSIYSWRDGILELVELHHEIRLEPAGEPLGEPS